MMLNEPRGLLSVIGPGLLIAATGVGAVVKGMIVPSIRNLIGGLLEWFLALMGGVGGTVKILCHGYWIREGAKNISLCRGSVLADPGPCIADP